MKNVLIGLQVVTALAVAFLFYKTYNTPTHQHSKSSPTNIGGQNGIKIGYFELDSLENQYVYMKEMRNALRTKEAGLNQKLSSIKNQYVALLKEYNQNGPNLSQSEQSTYQQKLAKLQNDYQVAETEGQQEMQGEGLRKMQDVKAKIQVYLKQYCEAKGFSFVFASNDADFLYYKDTVYNVTNDIIAELNAQHNKEKSK